MPRKAKSSKPKKMPADLRRVMGGGRITPQQFIAMDRKYSGSGLWGDIWSGLKNVGKFAWDNIAKPGLQASKIISNTVGKIPVIGAPLAGVAANAGYGRRRGGATVMLL